MPAILPQERRPDRSPVASLPSPQEITHFEAQIRALYLALRSLLIHDLNEKKLSYSAVQVLFIVTHDDGATMGEIQRQLGLAHSTVTGLVDTLHSRGLVERHHDPNDRRVIVVRPTERGVQEVAHLRAKRVEHLTAAWPPHVTSAELSMCSDLLERLAHELSAERIEGGV